MTTAEWALLVSLGSLFVSVCSAAVSIASVFIAYKAKEQARKAATLTSRIDAIGHLRHALEDVIISSITSETLHNIEQAMHLAKLVFSQDVDIVLGVARGTASLQRDQQTHGGMVAI